MARKLAIAAAQNIRWWYVERKTGCEARDAMNLKGLTNNVLYGFFVILWYIFVIFFI